MFILPSIANARELGGYVLPDGRTIKRGLLLRGGALNTASDDDIRSLADDYHLAKIFDFRTGIEVRYAPDREVPGATNIWMPAFDEELHTMDTPTLPAEAFRDLGNWLIVHAKEAHVQAVAKALYTDMVQREFTQIQYAGFLQNIVGTTEGAVYWHCSQGKDRTGLGAAFILAALGADRELIMRDYCVSNEYYTSDLAHFLPLVDSPEEKAAIQTFVGVNPLYFEAALDYIDETWGSMDAFLRGPLCLGDDDITILRDRYLE